MGSQDGEDGARRGRGISSRYSSSGSGRRVVSSYRRRSRSPPRMSRFRSSSIRRRPYIIPNQSVQNNGGRETPAPTMQPPVHPSNRFHQNRSVDVPPPPLSPPPFIDLRDNLNHSNNFVNNNNDAIDNNLTSFYAETMPNLLQFPLLQSFPGNGDFHNNVNSNIFDHNINNNNNNNNNNGGAPFRPIPGFHHDLNRPDHPGSFFNQFSNQY